MVSIDKHLTSALNDKDRTNEWNPLQSDYSPDDRMVTTLFAKPGSGKPFLTLSKLKKGIYEETSYLSLNSYIFFSDVGRAVFKTTFDLNDETSIILTHTSMLEEDKSWQVRIKNLDLTLLLNSVRFKPIGKYPSVFYITIEINTRPELMIAFVRGVMEALNRNPWEDGSGELDWEPFTKRTNVSRKEVIEQWITFSDSPELSFGYLEITNDPICPKCNKSIEGDWIICPFCGELSKDFQRDTLISK